MTKIVYGWAVDWNKIYRQEARNTKPDLSVDLFFSSKEKFLECYTGSNGEDQILVPLIVGDDYVPGDYISCEY